jgi:hypothetical protein
MDCTNGKKRGNSLICPLRNWKNGKNGTPRERGRFITSHSASSTCHFCRNKNTGEQSTDIPTSNHPTVIQGKKINRNIQIVSKPISHPAAAAFQGHQPRQILSPATLATDCLPALRPFSVELGDLPVKPVNDDQALFHGCGTASLGVPALDTVDLALSATQFRLNPIAQLALLVLWQVLIDKLHATSLSNTVFLVAMLSEVAPLPILAGIHDAVVVTHCCWKSLETALVPALASRVVYTTRMIDLLWFVVLDDRDLDWTGLKDLW